MVMKTILFIVSIIQEKPVTRQFINMWKLSLHFTHQRW